MGMNTIEPELRSPAPRPTRLRAGARRRFARNLALFLLIGGLPVARVVQQIWIYETVQQQGRAAEGVVLRRRDPLVIPGLRAYEIECLYAAPSGRTETARLTVPRAWWLASPPGSRVVITTCERVPGHALLGDPSGMQLSEELGIEGSGLLILGLSALLLFGSRLRPYFRDVALVSLGTPVPGRVVGRTCMGVRRWGRTVTLRMVHLQFRDRYGVERIRTQMVDRRTWEQVVEGEEMTVLVCARRRGWFAAYRLLMAEATPSKRAAPLSLGPEHQA
jgi:hypothetical protein